MIKDLENNFLLPVVIWNTTGQYGYDEIDGKQYVLYIQIDGEGWAHRLFRHQIGTLVRSD